jgi:hypothetical protein
MTPRSRPRVLTGDRRILAGAFVTLFGMSAAHALLETARDALFLARLPASQLPWAYFAIAAAAAAISRLPVPAGRSSLGRRALALMLLGSAAVTCAFWAAGTPDSPWMLRGLYVWTGVNATLTGLQFWYVVGDLWTITQAKRVYRWVAFGGLVGSVAGAAFARALASAGDPDRLVLASAVVQALTGLAPALLLSTSEHAAPRARLSLASAVQLLRSEPYVRGLASIALLSTLAFTAADLSQEQRGPRGRSRSTRVVLRDLYTVLNGLALVTQLVATGWLIRVLAAGRPAGPARAALRGVRGRRPEAGARRRPPEARGWQLPRDPPHHERASRRPGTGRRARPDEAVPRRRRPPRRAGAGVRRDHRRDGPPAQRPGSPRRGGLCLAWVVQAVALRQPYLDLFRSALRERRLPGPPISLPWTWDRSRRSSPRSARATMTR